MHTISETPTLLFYFTIYVLFRRGFEITNITSITYMFSMCHHHPVLPLQPFSCQIWLDILQFGRMISNLATSRLAGQRRILTRKKVFSRTFLMNRFIGEQMYIVNYLSWTSMPNITAINQNSRIQLYFFIIVINNKIV